MLPRTLVLIVLLLGTSAFAAELPGENPQRLDGTWVLQSVEINGEKLAIHDFAVGTTQEARLVIRGHEYLFYLGQQKVAFTYKTNPATTPAEIDLIMVNGADQGKLFRGIYRLQGDTYTICRHLQPEKPRPVEFTTTVNSGLMLVVWKRLHQP